LVLKNGKIISMDSRNRIFEAVAAKDGKIVAVTSNKGIARFIGENTRVIDLAGKTVTPGLIDTHSHLALAGVDMMFIPDLARPEVKRVKEVLDIVRERASQLKKGEWITVRNFEEQYLDEKRSVTRSELDSISPEHPVAVFCEDGHRLIVNSLALQLAGVTADTPDLEGFIVKDQNGQLTGLLRESAMGYVTVKIPPWTVEQLEEGIKAAQEEWIKVGLSANKDPGLFEPSHRMIQAYRNLHAKGQLKVRSDVLWLTHEAADIDCASAEFRGPADDMLKIGGIKIFLDGAMRIRTAWMHDEFNVDYNRVDTGNRGYPVIDLELFKNLVLEAHKRGLQICIHAIGDRAVDTALDAIEQALKKAPRKDHRHTLIHAEVPTRQALRRMKSLRVAVETQTVFLHSMDDLAGNLGPKRAKRAMPMKSYMKLGITVGNGADADFYPLAPSTGLYSACTRRPRKEPFGPKVFGTSECLTVREALKTYTTLAAKCLFWEDRIGSIEPGKCADFVVWSEDLYSVPAEKLKDVEAEMTIIGGIVHKAKDSSRLSP